MVTFLNHFRPYLLGRQFKLRRDHGPLVWIRNFKEREGQLACWLEQLEEFDFEIVHRSGKLHNNVDALSRLPCDQNADALVDQMVATISVIYLHLSRPEKPAVGGQPCGTFSES